MKLLKWLSAVLVLAVAAGCGGGGSGGTANGAISGHVPYLLSSPTVTYSLSSYITTSYDVTVTLQADGPTGVAYVDLWIIDDSDGSDSQPIQLANITGTKYWTGTTEYYLPLTPGSYHLDTIVLDDGDPLTADPLREGWYSVEPLFSTTTYFVDESEFPKDRSTFLFFNFGVTGIHVTRFTLP